MLIVHAFLLTDDDSHSDMDDDAEDGGNGDYVDSQEKETSKPPEKFSNNPLYRAAFAMASKYNKLVDAADDEDDKEKMVKTKPVKNSEKEEKASSKYNKLVDESNDRTKPYKVKQVVNNGNKRNEVECDNNGKNEDTDALNYKKPLPKNTHITSTGAIIRPRRRQESSSSHADEDGHSEQKGTEFYYRELDDEYGSRPSAHTTKKDHDVISMVSTSSQEYDPAPKHIPIPAPRRSISEAENEGTPPEKPDPIIGHEHGVRPLLDDDELENAYGPNQSQPVQKLAESASETETIYTSPQSSVPTSPVPKPETSDVFGAAPFKKKTFRKKRPSSSLQSAIAESKQEPHKAVKGKPVVPPKPGKLSSSFSRDDVGKVNKHKNKRHVSGGEMSVGLLDRSDDDSDDNEDALYNDIFGNAPFMKRSSSSTDAVLHSISPNCDSTKRGTCDQRNGIANSLSADSLTKAPEQIPESFSTLPFTNYINTTIPNTSTAARTAPRPPQVPIAQNQPASSSFKSQITILPNKQKAFPATLDASGGAIAKPAPVAMVTKQNSQMSRERESNAPSPSYSKFKDESDSDDDEFEQSDKKAYVKVKPSRSPHPADRSFESSAFSNMSFNDDFDDEVDDTKRQGVSVSMNEASLQAMKSSQSQELSVQRGQTQGFVKEPSPVNQNSAKTGYDTFTWPRKGHKASMKSHATAEPFTVKKKRDSIFK